MDSGGGSVLVWLRWWADLLDSRFRIPGTNIRFGLDPVLSLLPGVGDLVSPVFAVVLIVQALALGVSRVVILRMVMNALTDAMVSAVPIAGTIGDVFWRANAMNLALLEQHVRPGARPSRGDYLFVFGLAAVFGMLLFVPILIGIWLTLTLVHAVTG